MKENVFMAKEAERLGLTKSFTESTNKQLAQEFNTFMTSSTPILQIQSFVKLVKLIPHDLTTPFIKFCTKILFKDETKYLHKSIISWMNAMNSEKIWMTAFESELLVFIQAVVLDDSFESNLAVIDSLYTSHEFVNFSALVKKHFFDFIQILLPLLKIYITDLKLVKYDHFTTLIVKRIQTVLYKSNEQFFQSVTDDKNHGVYSTLVNYLIKILELSNFSKESKKMSGMLFCFILNLKKDLTAFYMSVFTQKPKQYLSDSPRFSTFTKLLTQGDFVEFARLYAKFDQMGKIAIQHAILQISSSDVYTKEIDGKSLLMDIIVPEVISKLDITTNQHEYFFNLQTLWSCLDKFLDIVKKDVGKHVRIAQYNKIILNFIWNNWENPISNIFEILKKCFDLIMEMYDVFSDEVKYIIKLNDLVVSLLEVDWNRKGKYPTLLRVLPHVGGRFLIQRCPKMFSSMLQVMGNPVVCTQAANLYEGVLMSLLTIEKDVSKWRQVCLDPIVAILTESTDDVTKSAVVTYIFPRVIKMDQANLDYILTCISKKPNVNRTIIQILNICKPLGLLKNELDQNLHFVEEGMLDLNEDLRVTVFELLTSSIKLDLPHVKELELIKKFLQQNSNESTSTFRSKLNPLFVKFLLRLKTAISKAYRQLSSQEKFFIENPNKEVKENKRDSILLHAEKCVEFLRWILQLIENSLYPGCPHDKTVFCLSLYNILMDHFTDEVSIGISVVFWKPLDVYPEGFVKPLLNLFFDPYEKVRIQSFEILKRFPSPLPGLNGELDSIIDYGMKLLHVGKLKEADAGSCILRLLYHKYILKEINLKQLCIPSEGKPLQYQFFAYFLKYLQDRVEKGEKDIFEIVSKSTVIGGLILLKNIILDSTFEGYYWKDYFGSLLICLDKIKGVCGKVICEFGEEDESSVDCRGHIYFKDKVNASTVHALIVNSWLAVKETMYVMSSIAEKFPLVDSNQWDLIGNFFTQIMLATKHNGVIERGAVAFQQICRCLFKKGSDLPEIWLNQFLQVITTDDKILRRSAGLPFSINAILITEGNHKKLLNKTIEYLFQVFENENEKESSRVHALNVINSIVCEASLSQYIHHFIEKGFIMTLNGFSSTSWNIRNSSLMAYTSLIRRAIPSIMQNIHSNEKNVTFIEFFTRNPTLRNYLIEKTKSLLNEQELHASLFPILLLLSKLSPGIFDGNQNINATALIEFVVKCTHHPNAMVRSISSKALLPLVSLSKTNNFLKSLFDVNATSTNHLHGRFLTLFEFLKNNRADDVVFSLLQVSQFSSSCPLIKTTFLEILSICVHRFEVTQHAILYKNLMEKLSTHTQIDSKFGISTVSLESKSLKLLLILSSKLNPKETTDKIIWNHLSLKSHQRLAVCEFLLDQPELVTPKLKQKIASLIFQEDEVLTLEKLLSCIYTFDISPVDHYVYWDKLVELYTDHKNAQIKQQTILCIGHEVKNMLMNRDPVHFDKIFPFWYDVLTMGDEEEYNRLACVKSIELSTILNTDRKEKIQVLFVSLGALSDDSEQVRVNISQQLNALLKTQGVGMTLLQPVHKYLCEAYARDPLYYQLLLDKLSFKYKDGKLDLPFSNLKFKLFDKDIENLYQEEIYDIQISAYYARSVFSMFDTRRNDAIELSKQLDIILDQVVSMDLNVFGGVSSQREIFIALYKLLFGIYSLYGGQDDEVRKSISRLLLMDKQLNPRLMDLVSLIMGESMQSVHVFHLVK